MIGYAKPWMRGELSSLWQEAFEEPRHIPDSFLKHEAALKNCLVYTVSGKPVSAVYLLPTEIALQGGRTAKAHYIFAAATFHRFRSRGYMAALLNQAAREGEKHGQTYSVVLPSRPELYPYYAKFGYSPFFQARTVSVPRDTLCSIASEATIAGSGYAEKARLNALRNSVLSGRTGSMLWDDVMFRLCVHTVAAYGDRLAAFASKGHAAYALCRPAGNGVCLVLEAMAQDRVSFSGLARQILLQLPAEEYRFRLPAGSGLFEGLGETVPFGMIRSLRGADAEALEPKNPYLGFALD